MKREKLDLMKERDLLVGLITSRKFCREIAPILQPRFLQVDYAKIIASWVQEFWFKFESVPERDIIKVYRAKIQEIQDESLQDNILTFIERLNRDYDKMRTLNEDYAIFQSILYLKGRSLERLYEDVESYVENGEVQKAEDVITKYRTVETLSTDSVSLLKSPDAIINAILDENQILFTLPGAYGKVIGDIHREDFISFLAPMKRGKTWALIDVAVNAVRQGMKVFFVSMEMSQANMLKRFWTSLTGQILKDNDSINYPYFEKDGDKYIVETKTISRKAYTLEDIIKRQGSMKMLFRGGDIRVLCVPAYTLTVESLELKIDRLIQQEEFVPDVIIVDYADIMTPSDRTEYRNQLDGIWKRLRSMAQKRKAVVFTASQAGRASLNGDANAENIAEDIRKLAHITSMVSLNQTAKEKQKGILRLKQLAIRDGETEFRQVICTQCLAIGRIVTDSKFAEEVDLDLGEDKKEDKNL